MKTLEIYLPNSILKEFQEVQDRIAELMGKFKAQTEDLHLPITERVKNFDDIERISGIKLFKREDETTDEYAYRQAKLIAKVYNNGVELDPMDTDQYKYFPWHKTDNSSGSGLSYGGYATWLSNTAVGVRLCFVSSESAADAGKKFIEIYSNLKIK